MDRIITNAALIAVNDYYETVLPLARQSCRTGWENKLHEPRSLFAPKGTSYTLYNAPTGLMIAYSMSDMPEGSYPNPLVYTQTVGDGETIITKMDPFATVTVNGRTVTHDITTLDGMSTHDLLLALLAVIAQTPPCFVFNVITVSTPVQSYERRNIHAPLEMLSAVVTYLQDMVDGIDTTMTHIEPSAASKSIAFNAFRAVHEYQRSVMNVRNDAKYLDRNYCIVERAAGRITDKNIDDRYLFSMYEAIVALTAQTPLSSVSDAYLTGKWKGFYTALDAPIVTLTSAISFIRRELICKRDERRLANMTAAIPVQPVVREKTYDDLLADNKRLAAVIAELTKEKEALEDRLEAIVAFVDRK
jgi:hypothetical protein